MTDKLANPFCENISHESHIAFSFGPSNLVVFYYVQLHVYLTCNYKCILQNLDQYKYEISIDENNE